MDQIKLYHKNQNVITTELEDGAILLNLNTKYYYNLNETGLVIWKALDETGKPEAIVTKLTNEYNIDRTHASACLHELLEDLEKERLIFGHT